MVGGMVHGGLITVFYYFFLDVSNMYLPIYEIMLKV